MARRRSARLSVPILVSLLFYLVVVGFSGRAAPVAQSSAALVQIVPNASTAGSLAYDPDVIKVVIGVNNTVVWRNNDNVVHTATGTNFTGFTTGNIKPGNSSSFTFNTAGTYPYHCIYHPGMVGTVIVKGSVVSAVSTASSGGGIPELPFQFVLVVAFATLLVGSYLLVRRNRAP
jgi:plastocyanin